MATIIDLNKEELPADGYVFKHSTRCGVSAGAAAAVRSRELDLPVYWVNVIEQRAISDWVSKTLGVRHESPQLIEIRGGKVVRVLSHGEINRSSLTATATP